MMDGVLGKVYSASDSFKRRLVDALRNPGAAAEQMIGNANDRARGLNEMTGEAAKEGLRFGPATERLANKMADAYSPAGMLFNTSGLPNRGRELINSEAERLADLLRRQKFDATVQHSGSAAGPSSYLNVFDPLTERYFTKQVRLSGHPKGVFNSQGVWDVNSDEFGDVLKAAGQMRDMGKSQSILMREEAEKLIALGVKPKTAYRQAQEMFSFEGK